MPESQTVKDALTNTATRALTATMKSMSIDIFDKTFTDSDSDSNETNPKSSHGQPSPTFHQHNQATLVHPGDFESENHFYPRVLNATIHPLVASFFQLGNERIMARYAHLNPQVKFKLDKLRECLAYQPKRFKWAGECRDTERLWMEANNKVRDSDTLRLSRSFS